MNMKRIAAMSLGVFVVAFGVSGVAWAQNRIRVQGTIQSVDCQANTLVLRAPDGTTNVVPVTAYTAIFVDGAPINFCGLQKYIGRYATALVTAAGNQLVAGRVDVSPAVTRSALPYYGCCGYYPNYQYPFGYYGPPLLPGIGIGIGVIVGPPFMQFHRGRFVEGPRFHRGFARSPRAFLLHGGAEHFAVGPGFHGGAGHFPVAPAFHGHIVAPQWFPGYFRTGHPSHAGGVEGH
jgi:hypothetical protein